MRKRSVRRIMQNIKLRVLENDYYEMGLVCGKLCIVDYVLNKFKKLTRIAEKRKAFLKGVEDSPDMPWEALAHEFHLLYDAGGKQFLRSVDAISGTKIMVAVHSLIVDADKDWETPEMVEIGNSMLDMRLDDLQESERVGDTYRLMGGLKWGLNNE